MRNMAEEPSGPCILAISSNIASCSGNDGAEREREKDKERERDTHTHTHTESERERESRTGTETGIGRGGGGGGRRARGRNRLACPELEPWLSGLPSCNTSTPRGHKAAWQPPQLSDSRSFNFSPCSSIA